MQKKQDEQDRQLNETLDSKPVNRNGNGKFIAQHCLGTSTQQQKSRSDIHVFDFTSFVDSKDLKQGNHLKTAMQKKGARRRLRKKRNFAPNELFQLTFRSERPTLTKGRSCEKGEVESTEITKRLFLRLPHIVLIKITMFFFDSFIND